MSRRLRVRLGDVFLIPTGDGRAGVGQVVATYERHAYYFAVHSLVALEGSPHLPSAADALRDPVRWMALSFDAKLHHGDWPVIGNLPITEGLPLPAYKEAVSTFDHVDVVDYSGKRRRRASKQEAASLPNRRIVSPIRLEMALRASVGLIPNDARDDELTPSPHVTRDFFPGTPTS